jgi:glycosyltransferase involved in cell wall biosynthesis
MIHCQKSSDKIGIVGPLSNTASWQSIPEVFDANGDWAHNKLDMELDYFSKLISENSSRVYPLIPLLNGFCMLIHKSVVDSIGYFDEENFGSGFAEEDDYNLRAGKAGFKLALADNTYIFHAQSKSYTNEKRLALCMENGAKLRAKHGDALLDSCVQTLKDNLVMASIRSNVRTLSERDSLISKAMKKWEGKRILILLPIVDSGGGGNVIIQEAIAMRRMGIDVCLYNVNIHKDMFENNHPGLSVPVIYGDYLDSFRVHAGKFDVVCATVYSTAELCNFSELNISTRAAYYIQDYEPNFFENNTPEYDKSFASYTAVPGMTLVTKSEWNRVLVKEKTGANPIVIGKSFDIDLYRPRKLFPNTDKITIAAMVRPNSPRRAPQLTLDVLNDIALKYNDKVEIIVFGSDPEHDPGDKLFWDENYKNPQIRNLGKLDKNEMVTLLSYADVFADFSSFQAMGLTLMEAMACGCCVIAPRNGGAIEFINHGVNGLIVDAESKNDCISSLSQVINNSACLHQFAYQAINDICEYYPEKCAYAFLEACFPPDGRN